MKYPSLLAGIFAFLAIQTAQAQMIGVDFSGGARTPISGTETAGVVAQQNWNNLSTTSGSLSSVIDNSNTTVSGLTVTWGTDGSNDFWPFGGGAFANPGDTNLFSDTLQSRTSTPDGTQPWRVTFSVTGITYASYDIYVYTAGNTGDVGLVNLNGTWSGNAPVGGTSTYFTQTGGAASSFIEANPAQTTYSTTAAAANYVLFTDVTGSSFTLNAQPGSNDGIVGFQIVDNATAVPEPSTCALLLMGVGLLGLSPLRGLVRRQALAVA